MAEVPSGIPEVLYNFPTIHGGWAYNMYIILTACIICIPPCLYTGAQDYKHTISNQTISEVKLLLDKEPVMVCPRYQCLADNILKQYNISQPKNFEEGFGVYLFLVQTVSDLLN